MYSPWWVPVTVFLHDDLVALGDHVLDRDVQVGEGAQERRPHVLERLRPAHVDRQRRAEQQVRRDEFVDRAPMTAGRGCSWPRAGGRSSLCACCRHVALLRQVWRTAWISRLIDTLSPTTTPPLSIGMMLSMPKSRAADLRGRGEAGPLPAERVGAEPVRLDGEGHLPGDAVQRQVTVDDPAAAGPRGRRWSGSSSSGTSRHRGSRRSGGGRHGVRVPVSMDARSIVAVTEEASGSSAVTIVTS